LWSTVLFISGNSITQERWSGTLELLVGAPTPLSFVAFGKILANVIQSLGSILLCYTVAVFAFGYIPTIQHPALFAASLVFAVLSFVSFGLIISTVFILNPEVQALQNGLEFPFYILCGFLFPIALLPFWTTPFSYILAPYWAARALHATSSGWQGFGEVALCWGMMTLLGLIYVFFARILFRKVLYKARVDATLEVQ
jgi:ABC-2 type transport system permease protein